MGKLYWDKNISTQLLYPVSNNKSLLQPPVYRDIRATSRSQCWLTSHFSFKENKVLKKNTIQIMGQMMRPSQKMRASASVAAI